MNTNIKTYMYLVTIKKCVKVRNIVRKKMMHYNYTNTAALAKKFSFSLLIEV